MRIFKFVEPLQRFLDDRRAAGDRIGFVPTMGALHEGHLSLIRRSQADNDLTVCSIFVNPTQFNEVSDLEKYPRTPAQDIEKLEAMGNDVLFMPEVEEIYPPGVDLYIDLDLGGLDGVMEGAFRPGHFEGVVKVVKRLLDIVSPYRLYMGQKDYQQFIIIRHMIRQLQLPVELVVCPILREPDGLAMSSRNERLSESDRRRAIVIYQALLEAHRKMEDHSPAEISCQALRQIEQAGLQPEYFKIVDAITLQPIDRFADAAEVVACAAAWTGNVRLIDNLILKKEGNRVPAL
jgi:pantoate--beta-alanine ligase